MAYNYETNTFKYSERLSLKESEEFDIETERFVILLTYHELGHYLDFQSNPYKVQYINDHKKQLELEEGAWDYGKTIIPDELIEDFDRINSQNYSKHTFWSNNTN